MNFADLIFIINLASSWFNSSQDDDLNDYDRTATMIPNRLPLKIVKVHQVIYINFIMILKFILIMIFRWIKMS
jgi:hypothetical protein